MTTSSSDADILDRAADRLEKPGAWCKMWMARDADGRIVSALDNGATAWCMAGALSREATDVHSMSRIYAAVRKHIKNTSIADWNDDHRRTQSEVVAALRETAKRLRGEST